MSEIEFNAGLLRKLFLKNNFPFPDEHMVFFGIRGMLPIDPDGTAFSQMHKLRFAEVNYLHMRCTLGQWKPKDDTIAVFPGSTAPSRPNVKRALQHDGTGSNLLVLGFYEYKKGQHKLGKPSGHRAFRQNRFFPGWRTRDDLDYDADDRIDLGRNVRDYFWDNLHCAYHDSLDQPGYSSAGCQVVAGHPRSPARGNKPETGPWKRFIENAYDHAGGQDVFHYALFASTEVAATASKKDSEISQSVRFGSSGDLVKALQGKLLGADYDIGEADGDFGRNTLEALMSFQDKEFGRSDGIVGLNTAAALGLAMPALSTAQPAALPPLAAETPRGDRAETEDESDLPGMDSIEPRPSLHLLDDQGTPGSAPRKVVVEEDAKGRWTAQIDGAPGFYVGSTVKYLSYRGVHQPGDKLATLPGGLYDAATYEKALGSRGAWAWFLLPTIIGESQGHWGRINTYDGAGPTFGPLQFASHTPNDNLILLFRRLLALPEAQAWFPNLTLKNGKVHERTASGQLASLEDGVVGGRLVEFMEYLNPDAKAVNKGEVINAAKLIAWCAESEVFRNTQIELAIERFQSRVNRLEDAYHTPLGKQPIYRVIWVADILHHGRGSYKTLQKAFASSDPEVALESIGADSDRWKERIRTVKAAIKKLKSENRLDNFKWGQAPFV